MDDRDTAWIIGSGGQAKVVASFLRHRRVRRLVEHSPAGDDVLQADFFAAGVREPGDYFIAIGDNTIRRRYFDRLRAMGIVAARCIAESAWIAPDAVLGDGVFIGQGAVIGAGARIGDNAMVNNQSLVDHDSHLGEDSQVTVNVAIGAEVRIGRRCFFGMSSTVVSRVEVGDDVFVMAGAVVVRSVPDGARVGGLPAKIMPARGENFG